MFHRPAAVLIAIFAFTHHHGPAWAESIEELYEIIDSGSEVYSDAKQVALEEIFSPEGLKTHRRRLAENDCIAALIILTRQFGWANRTLPNPGYGTDGAMAWKYAIAPKHYPRAYFCSVAQSFQFSRGRLEKTNTTPVRLFQKKRPPKPARRLRGLEDSLLFATRNLVISAIFDHAPALLKLAQLSEKAEVIRLTPAFNYYALARAKHKGLDYPDLNRLLAKAKKEISSKEKRRLAPRIAAGGWPREEAIVID